MRTLFAAGVVAVLAAMASADVYFVEQVVNPGFGKKKLGARQTRSEIYLQGKRQKVASAITAPKKTMQALRQQGQPLQSSTILDLEQMQVIEANLDNQTYVQRPAPAPAEGGTAAAKPVAQAGAGAPQIQFAVKEMGDSAIVAGIPCRHVVAQMRAQYLDPRTGAVQRENRYTYDAWLARDFPGYEEIVAFQQLQRASTSYPPLIAGGMEQAAAAMEDGQRLASELASLEGFPLRSSIRASVVRASRKGETEVFRLDRQITEFRRAALADTVFAVPGTLVRVAP